MSFVARKIELTFELGNAATFAPSSDNTVTLTDHRVSVSITKTVGPATGEARVMVYGLAPNLLNQLASLNSATASVQNNRIIVKAGDAEKGMATVFAGQIILAQADMNQQPNTFLNILAVGTGLHAMQNIGPTGYPGSADAAVILRNLATAGNMAFQNWGASKILQDAYSWGDVRTQIRDYAQMAGFEHFVEDADTPKATLHIWPKGKARGDDVPLISPTTGLIGFPTYSSWAEGGGIAVRTMFNPLLHIGGTVKVESDLIAANGTWLVFFLSHELQSEVPGGQWVTQFHGGGLGNA